MAIQKLPTSVINKANGQPVDASEWNQVGGKVNELIDSDGTKAEQSDMNTVLDRTAALQASKADKSDVDQKVGQVDAKVAALDQNVSELRHKWTYSNLDQYIVSMYVENKENAIADGLALTIVDYTYSVFYMGTTGGGITALSLGMSTLPNGHRYHSNYNSRYGQIFLEVIAGDGQRRADSGNRANLCDNVFDPTSFRAFMDATSVVHNLVAGVVSPVFCLDPNINQYLDYLYVENMDVAISNGLFISLLFPQYNCVWFGFNKQSNMFSVVYDTTTYEGQMVHETYGLVKVKVKPTSVRTASSGSNYNIGKDSYLFFTNGIIPLKGKKILAIGDSVTAYGQWANRVATLTGATATLHAKGGIGIIAMVDGDNAGFAALSTNDVSDKDIIILMGFYNARDLAVQNPGNETDMYPTQNTFIGQLNYAINKVYAKLKEAGNINCRVIIVTAHKYGKYEWNDRSAYTPVTSGGIQTTDGEAIFEATKKAANYNSLFLVDLMHGGNINKYNWNEFQSRDTPYNPLYIPADGVADGTNKPFATLSSAPSASANNGKYITISGVSGCYLSDGTRWNANSIPYIWNADQLHPNIAGYLRIGDFIAAQLRTVL